MRCVHCRGVDLTLTAQGMGDVPEGLTVRFGARLDGGDALCEAALAADEDGG
jgi:hypothetical protein